MNILKKCIKHSCVLLRHDETVARCSVNMGRFGYINDRKISTTPTNVYDGQCIAAMSGSGSAPLPVAAYGQIKGIARLKTEKKVI